MPIASKPSVLVPDGECGCGPFAHLPEGVCRVAPAALGAERLIPPEPARNEAGKVQVAVVMFDGLVSNTQVSDFLLRPITRVPHQADTGRKVYDYLSGGGVIMAGEQSSRIMVIPASSSGM